MMNTSFIPTPTLMYYTYSSCIYGIHNASFLPDTNKNKPVQIPLINKQVLRLRRAHLGLGRINCVHKTRNMNIFCMNQSQMKKEKIRNKKNKKRNYFTTEKHFTDKL